MGYTADTLFESVQNMEHESGLTPGAIVDFGLSLVDAGSQDEVERRFYALYECIDAGEITLEQLRKVSGDGPAITKLVNACKSNPYPGIKFTTTYDDMAGDSDFVHPSILNGKRGA